MAVKSLVASIAFTLCVLIFSTATLFSHDHSIHLGMNVLKVDKVTISLNETNIYSESLNPLITFRNCTLPTFSKYESVETSVLISNHATDCFSTFILTEKCPVFGNENYGTLLNLVIYAFSYNGSIEQLSANSYKIPLSAIFHIDRTAISLCTRCKTNLRGRAALVIALLIILSGDVELNPGPKNLKYPCSVCNNEVKKNQEALKCTECKKWSHRTCANISKEEYRKLQSKKFVWICPTPSCSPSYENETSHIKTSANNYNLLKEENISNKKFMKEKQTKQSKNKTAEPKTKKVKEINLWKHLTKIKPKDYQGHEICNDCNKRINEGSKYMLCIECERCTHRRCSKLKSGIYNEQRNIWTCNKCLKPDDMPENTTFCSEEFANISGTRITTMKELKEIKSKQKNSKLWIHFNCRSIQNAYEEIQVICSTVLPDFILLTETWMDDSNPAAAFIPKGYLMKRKDRSEVFKHKYGKERGGGVAILHKENINATIMSSLHTEEDETMWIKVKDKQKTLLVACTYRTSYCDLLEGETTKLEANLTKASSLSKNIMLFGDLNCDLNEATPDKPTKKLTSCMSEMNLQQTITGATRIESGKPKLIDHIWIEEQMMEDVETSGICTGISDHAGIYAFIKAKTEEEEKVTCRNYRNYEKEKLCEDFNTKLENSEFQEFIRTKNVNKATECWTKCFQEAIENNAPMKTFTKKNCSKIPWFTDEVRRLIERKNSMLKLWYLYRKNEDRTIYRKLKNELNHLKKKVKSEHYSTKIEELQKKPRLLWNLYKEITGNTKLKECIEPDFMDKTKANQFNNFFATVGSNIQQKLNITTQPPQLPMNGFEFKYETEETVRKLISRIRSDVATGNDNINAKLVKDAIDTIIPSITQLVNLSYETRTFPDTMKEAIVRPLFKKEDKEKPEYYRPVSILPVISKVFERSATDQLITYLEKHNLLATTQHAYRRLHSTVTCLADLVDEIRRRRDRNETVGVIGMDLSKAFDSINHNILQQKLIEIGIGPNVITWMKSYLTNRKQLVKFKNIQSDKETVTSGVPQGSILGPVLFIIFTNNLTEYLHNYQISSYADDTQILISASSPKEMKEKIEEVMRIAQEWYTKHSLLNNLTKTEIMIVTSKKNQKNYKDLKYTIKENGKTTNIKGTENMKILGVWIDEDLTWNKQISTMKGKAFNNARNLCRVNQELPMKTKIQLYNSYVASQLGYADIIWGGCSEENKNKLQRVQNFSLRSMTGKTSSEEARNGLKFLTLEEKRNIHYGVYAYKLTNGLAPTTQTAIFKKHQATSQRIEERGLMKPPIHRTQQFEMSTIYKTIKEWNRIPAELKTCKTATEFKTKLQNSKCQAVL